VVKFILPANGVSLGDITCFGKNLQKVAQSKDHLFNDLNKLHIQKHL
jgi:hypothetical protein